MTKSGIVFFYHPNTQFENLGDLVLNERLLTQLRARGRLHVLKDGIPDEFWGELDVRGEEVFPGGKLQFFGSMVIRSLLLRKKVVLVTKPGDVISLVGQLPSPKREIKAISFLGLRAAGVKICAIGISTRAENFKRSFLERFSADQYFGRVVRDSKSYEAARSFRGKLLLGSDLAFLLDAQHELASMNGAKNEIALSFRKPSDLKTEEKIVASLRNLRKCPNIRLVPTYQVDRDFEFMSWISSQLDLGKPVKISGGPESYKSMVGAVSNRLHVLLFAWLAGGAPTALVTEENQKICSLFDDLNITDRLVTVGTVLTPDDLLAFDHQKGIQEIGRARQRLLDAINMLVDDL